MIAPQRSARTQAALDASLVAGATARIPLGSEAALPLSATLALRAQLSP